MVRNRKRKTIIGTFSEESMKKAVDLVINGLSIRKAASQTHIAYQTLFRYVKKQKTSDENSGLVRMRPNYQCRMIFTPEQETVLADYILDYAKMYYGLTTTECRRLAYQMAKLNGLRYPEAWDIQETAGIEWFRGFMKREVKLSIRTPEGCSLSRATSFSQYNVAIFFEKLQIIFNREPQFSDGTRIFNLDETATTTVHKPPKVVAGKGAKQVCNSTSAEKGTLVTTCCIISAAGDSVPPVMIFPCVHFKEHMLRGAPPGTKGLSNPSGWMNAELFLQVLNHFIFHTNSSMARPSLLIYDNHESHLSIDVINIAKSNGVSILTIPPHSSNRLQPLDVAVFKPFKTYYHQAMDSWMMQNPGKTITIYEIAECVGEAHQRAMTPVNIKSAFKKTGIYPLNSNIFSEADFLCSAVSDRPFPRPPLPVATTSTSKDYYNYKGTHIMAQPIIESEPQGECSGLLTFISPQQFRGYPKAELRKGNTKGCQKQKSRVATDTQEKVLHEEKRRKNIVKDKDKMGNKVLKGEEMKSDVFVIQGIKIEEEEIKSKKLTFENETEKEEIDFEEEDFWLEEKVNCEEKFEISKVFDAESTRMPSTETMNTNNIDAGQESVKYTRCGSLVNDENYRAINSKISTSDKCVTIQTSCIEKGDSSNNKISHKFKLRSYQCDTCECCFDLKYQMQNHAASVHGKEKPFKCPECAYSCSQKCSLTKHIRSIHRREKPFFCSECGYSSGEKGTVVAHIISVHRKLKPYMCTDCNYSSSKNGDLGKHIMAVHRKFKPYKCTACDYSCSQKGSLSVHIRSVHRKEKPYKCAGCDYSCSQKGSLSLHIGSARCKRRSDRKSALNYINTESIIDMQIITP